MVADYEPIAAPKTDEEHQFNAQLSRVLATLVEMGEGPVKLSSREKRAVNKLLKNPDPKRSGSWRTPGSATATSARNC